MKSTEVQATTVLRMHIDEASAKIRVGGPKDDQEDYALPIWAGVVPLVQQAQEPEPDPLRKMDLELPESVRKLTTPIA